MSHGKVPALWIFAALLMLTVLGIGTLAWLSDVPTDQLTLAQTRLIDIADWLVKASVGAILGFAGGAGLAGRKDAK
ncbi:MAG: hypothetical protein F4X64_06515 [Chloroflexi bacterium]|nr:hypothetical protein [Chloroflexota bacterium]